MNTILLLTVVTCVLVVLGIISLCISYSIEDEDETKSYMYLAISVILFSVGGVTAWKCGEERDAICEQEKELLGVDDKGFYIKRIGTHDFIVNYAHEAYNPPVHDPGCPCGWKGIVVDKDTIPSSNFNSQK